MMQALGDIKHEKTSWPKILLKKCLNLNHADIDEFDDDDGDGPASQENDKTNLELHRNDICSRGRSNSKVEKAAGLDSIDDLSSYTSLALMPEESEILKSRLTEKQHLRMFVGTWNVGGKFPDGSIDLEEWLGLNDPADIYVLGFQEVVPLNAGNVLGAEDHLPVLRWLDLIRYTLNKIKNPPSPINNPSSPFSPNNREGDDDDEHFSLPNDIICSEEKGIPLRKDGRPFEERNDINFPDIYPNISSSCRSLLPSGLSVSPTQFDSMFCPYAMVASKQMVGIFVTVWVRSNLRPHVHNLKVSCVGRGLMGCLGNKGSISISMQLHQTTFCFVCSHLTSGEKQGDRFRRNSDVSFILKRTHFYQQATADLCLPETILEHNRVIWFGDLNYRLSLSSTATRSLLAKEDWETLLEKDQLRMERNAGRVFKGWNEGNIYFPPTYKYRTNSDRYTLEKGKLDQKRRVPAWCDRILWFGTGLKQLHYVRGESRFSDHRPVHSLFLVEVDVLSHRKLKQFLTFPLQELD